MLSLLLLTAVPAGTVHPGFLAPAAETMVPNDNRRPAGTWNGKVLTVRLEAREGMWYPEGPTSRGLPAAAWAEEGGPIQAPGPLIRVPAGTTVQVHLKNSLTRQLAVFGFGTKRGLADSLLLDAGGNASATFQATTPGTYYYLAHSTANPVGGQFDAESQLHGAIVVDDPAVTQRYPDRIFLMSWWFTLDSTSRTGLGTGTMAINGLSWPHTERIDLQQGDSVRWRVINLTEVDHPMHLHGFYFSVESKGDGQRDTAYAREQQRLAVTEILPPNHTATLTWAPTRPGNWIFHCHFIGHVSHLASLDMVSGKFNEAALDHHGSDRPHQMYGLVLGIRVSPTGRTPVEPEPSRTIRLLVRQQDRVYGEHVGFAYVLGGSKEESAPALPAPPGPVLVLERGRRVAVNIVNQSKERAAVHWHGIELESFPDGVPDWSGWGRTTLPSIGPGDSLTVRFTPPRAGTFMYHSHFNEDQQISSGLYAPLIVLEPGQRYDPDTDRILMFSSSGPTINVIAGPFAPTMLNGKVQPDPMEFRSGVTYRLRLINLTGDVNTIVNLLDGTEPVEWRAVAKDGAALPTSQATLRPATLFFDPGEIYDFEFTPRAPGSLTLRFGPPEAPPGLPPLPPKVDVLIRVK